MTSEVRYSYQVNTLSCECCSDSYSSIEIWDNGEYEEFECFTVIENENELRDYLAKVRPQFKDYTVDPESEWF